MGMKDLFGDLPFEEFVQRGLNAQNAADTAKRKGMANVHANNVTWNNRATEIIHSLPSGWIGIGEDMRHIVTDKIGHPTHPNAWGALTNSCLRAGWFKPTGKWISPKDVKSHSRPTREYRRL